MKTALMLLLSLTVGLAGLAVHAADADSVKVIPLGSHDGEFCRFDRALIFEDPDGTRILYDAGRTVRGADDPRLGQVDAVLLTHVHADHLGEAHQAAVNAGSCAQPDMSIVDTPESNTVKIVVEKHARLIVGGEMQSFFANKVQLAGGNSGQVQILRFGASTKVGAVTVASVPAVHSNGLSPAFLEGEPGPTLAAHGLTAYLGPAGGYVLQFSNGLVAYLSGDTGITAEQDVVVRRHYKASLAVINIGGTFTTGPLEAAYVINDLVKPRSVIPSHANEAATAGGLVIPGTLTETFINAVKVPAHLPLSGRTMEFDGGGKCVAGC